MSSDDHVGELLKLAGRRHMPDAAQMSRAKAAACAEWRHVVEHRRWRLSRWTFASAALVAVTLLAANWLSPVDGPVPASLPVEIGTLQTIVGSALVTRGNAGPKPVQEGTR